MNRRMGARGWLAHTQHDFGRMLLGRGTPARARALELLRDAAEAARDLGMTRLLGTVQRALAAPPPIETDAGLPTDMPTAVLRREGEYWTIGYEGRICRLRDTRGLALLAHLLRHPGRELHAVELIALGGGELGDPSGIVGDATAAQLEREGLSVSRFAGGVERLDARARAAYRARVAELRADLEDAQQCRDSARAVTVRHELDVFAHELARSVGIGGRDRFLGSDAERARSAVTRVIKRALGRIAEHHPVLGEHLARTVKTGTFCCYAPNAYGAVAWTF
jgi:hypothetical protein